MGAGKGAFPEDPEGGGCFAWRKKERYYKTLGGGDH